MPAVSIIIPVWNAERFIGASVESALAQTWRDLEVIVVDDGSTDNSSAIVRSFHDSRLKLIKQKNTGASAARNRGLTESCGDFVQFLDADDCLHSRKIETQMEILLDRPDSEITCCPWGKFEDQPESVHLEPQAVNRSSSPVDWLVSSWLGGGMMQTACWLTPRRLIQEAGPWDESLPGNPNDDGEFFCRVLLASSWVHFVPEAKVFYRVPRQDNVSRQFSNVAMTSLLSTYENYQHFVPQKTDNPTVRKALSNNFFSFIYQVSPHFSDLVSRAYASIRALGISHPPRVGGKTFRLISMTVGFRRALWLRDKSARFLN